MAGRGAALTRPAWLKHAEEAKLKDEEEKAAAARAAFDATFRDVDQGARSGNASSDSEADEADKLANKPIGPVDPSRCTAAGTGVGGGAAGAAASFVVVTKDSDGRRAPHGGAYIRVRITPGAGVGGTEQEAVVKDHSDGTYTVTYAVAKRGDYMVSVDCNGHPILGSPFPVFFSGGNPQVGGATLPTSAPILGSSPFLNGVAQPMSAFPNMGMTGIFPGMLSSLIPGLLPGATGGAVLPGIGASFGEVCRDYLNGRCARTDCKYNHPPQNQLMAALAAGSTMGGLSQMPMAPSAAAMAAAQSIAAAQAYQAAQAQAAAQQQQKQPSAGAGEVNGEALSAEEPAGSGEPSCTIHVSNLSPGLQVDHLRQLFGYCGTVVDCKISDSKTSAYVEFSKHEEAKSALELNNMDVKGASLKLELAKPARLVKQASTLSTSTATSTPTAAAQPAPPLPMMMQQAVAMQQLQFQQALFMQQAMATQQAAARAATVKSAAEMAAARAAEISKRLKGPNGEGQEEEEQPTRSRSQSVGRSRSKSKSKSPIRYRRNWHNQANSRSPSRFRRDRDRRSRSRSEDRFHKRSRSRDRGPHGRGGRDGYFRYHNRREWERGREREYQSRASRRSRSRSRSRVRRSRSQSRSPKYRKVHSSPMRRRREEGKPTRSLRRSRSTSRDRHRGSPKSSPARPGSPWRRRGKSVKEQDWGQGDQARNGHQVGMHAVDAKFGHDNEDLTEKSRQANNYALGSRTAGANDHCSRLTQDEENGTSTEPGLALEAAVKLDTGDKDRTERANENVVAGKSMEEVEHIKLEGIGMSKKERSSHETKPPWHPVGTGLEESPSRIKATCSQNQVEKHTREERGSGSQFVKLGEEPSQDEGLKPDDHVSSGIKSERLVPTEDPVETGHADDDPVARFDGDVLAPHDEDNNEEEQDKRRERHRRHRKKHSRDEIEVDKVEGDGDGDDPEGDRDGDRQGRKDKRRHKKRSRKDDEKKKRKHKHRRHRSPGGSIEGSPSIDAGRSKVAEVESGPQKRSSSKHKRKHRETSKSITCSLSSSD